MVWIMRRAAPKAGHMQLNATAHNQNAPRADEDVVN